MEYVSAAITMLIGLIITAVFNGLLSVSKKKKAEEGKKETDLQLIKKGIQAILKNDLKVRYEHWIEEGYAPDDARDDLEAEYKVYHSLGKNGVMDGRRAKFLDLPTEPQEKED
jgi:hypothetical protein